MKNGIQSIGGKKCFEGFGRAELASFVDFGSPALIDLTELCPLSVALDTGAVDIHVRTYHIDRKTTMDLEKHAIDMITPMVNPKEE